MGEKSKLSAKVLALIAAGASALVIGNQFLDEKEGNRLTAYRDGAGIWTICRGVTKGVYPGMKLTDAECDRLNQDALKAADADLTRLAPNVKLTPAQRAGIISFCTYNLGATRCKDTTFLKLLNQGNTPAACQQILRWIYDGGRDCRVDKSCRGQVIRRDQENELCNISKTSSGT